MVYGPEGGIGLLQVARMVTRMVTALYTAKGLYKAKGPDRVTRLCAFREEGRKRTKEAVVGSYPWSQ